MATISERIDSIITKLDTIIATPPADHAELSAKLDEIKADLGDVPAATPAPTSEPTA